MYSEVQDWLTHKLFKLKCSGKEEIMVVCVGGVSEQGKDSHTASVTPLSTCISL